MAKTGVFPVFDNKFKIGTSGRSSADSDMVTIKEMETFSVKIDGKVQEWSPMEEQGWTKRMTTGKAITLSLSGKLCPGDPGNDYVAAAAWKSGTDCDTKFEWEFPSGAKLAFDAVLNVTDIGGGDSTAVAALAFDCMSHGKPVYTPAPE
ncbi:phage tail tube protein [Anaeromassilibacillus senegalensis]|uniref:phage tail tube protein n=1 Tax=Anaeromassilibacillus senegalensis TaxID=1673717 RepID=UPI000681A2E3|nr:hypothetical protein [Anaeromassilibacillus senegalensis]